MKHVTNIATRLLFITAVIFLMTAMTTTASGQLKFEENFNYTAGTLLTANGWSAHSGTTNFQKVAVAGLSYAGYASSGIGLADTIVSTGEDVNKTWATLGNGSGTGSGTLYYSFLARIDNAQIASGNLGDYFFHLYKNSSTFTTRVFARRKSSDATKFSLGIAKSSTAANVSYSDSIYSIGTTYLVVVRYTILSGATNDTVALWINPTLGTSEPTPTVFELGTDKITTDIDTVIGVAIRQGATTQGPSGMVDGIRVGSAWQDVTGPLAAPTVTTGAASGITITAATLAGTVNPNNASTTVIFNYGTTGAYGSSVTATQSPLTAGGVAKAVSASLSGLIQNQLYHFQASGTNSQGTTAGLDATFTTVPDAPATTAATSVGETGFTANWTAGAGNPPATYTLDVATDAGFVSIVSSYPGIVSTSQAVTGLSGGTTYYYRVRGVDVGGTSANSNTTSQLTLPGAPTATGPTGIGASSFTAHWTAPSGTVIDYRLDVSADIGFGSFVTGYSDKTVAGTSDLVSGLGTGVKYYYRARAVNGTGPSANSNIDSATTLAASVPSLSDPTATAIGTTTATLGATIDNDNNDPDTERGVVWATTANPTTAGNKVVEGSTGVGVFTVAVSGLPNGTLVHYRGYAINGQGTGYTIDATFYTQKTEPSTHVGSFSATPTSPATIDLSWTVATGADGYIILKKTGSDPTGTPSDATEYTDNQVLGDGTVAAMLTSGLATTTEISGLTPSTDYHFSIMPFAWDGAQWPTINYKTDPTIPTANATTFSKESDVIATPGFIYGSNIDYKLYTSVTNIDTTNSLPAFGVTVRDGGAGTDVDAVGTEVVAISFTVTNSANLTRAALYDGGIELGEVAVSGPTVTFNPIALFVADGGSKNLRLRVAYATTVTDNAQLAFTVSSVTADGAGSGFAAANGGGATSSTAGDDNRIVVTGTELHFVSNIANTPVSTNFTASARSTDVNLNTDVDFTGVVTFAKASGPGTLSGTAAPSAVSGVATTTNLQFDVGGYYTLSASATPHTPATSNTFVIISPAVFKVAALLSIASESSVTAVDTLSWDSPSTWTILSGGSATGTPHSKDQVILDHTYRTGPYVVRCGPTISDSAAQLTIGYPGNTVPIVLLIPHDVPAGITPLRFGNGVAGDYDMIIAGGGTVYDSKDDFHNNVRFNSLNDSMWIRTGGLWYHNTSAFNTMHRILSRRFDGDYGTIEFDVSEATGFFDISGGGNYWYPNVVLSNTHGAATYYWFGFGATTIRGDFTVNPGAKDSMMLTGYPFIHFGNIVNNGIMMGTTSTLAFAGSSAQTVSGSNPISLGAGMVSWNPNGVNFLTNVNVTGGTVQTTGTFTYDSTGLGVFFVNRTATGIINTGTSTMYMNPSGSLNEGNNPVQGNVSATRTASQSVNQTFGTIGIEINASGGAPGSTTVLRKTGTALSGNGHSSIMRYYDISPTNNSGLNATLKFSYAVAELNGNPEADLLLHKSTDGGTTWTGKSGTVNTSLHNINATGVNSFSRWTAASANAPLFITHTITVRKLQDLDGNVFTTGDQTSKKWRLSLYRDSVTAGTLVNTQNLNSGIMATLNLEAGTYIAAEEDSTGWLHLGKVHNGTTLAGGDKYDTVTVSGGTPGTIDFINQQVSALVVRKFKDTDGDPNTIESAKKWHLSIYKGSISGGNLVSEADTSELTVAGIQAGTYIVAEADSGPSWVRLNGNQTRFDTLFVPAATTVTDTLINFRPNSITVRKFQDNDGDFGTNGDQVAKPWYLEVLKGATPVASNSTGVITLANLGDGSYTINEADSAGWIHLGQVINGVPVGGTSNTYIAVVVDGQAVTVNFVNAPPAYSKLFRSFRADSIALDRDNFGKLGKFVKRKADKVHVKLVITAPKHATGFTLKFSMPFTGKIYNDLAKTILLDSMVAVKEKSVTTTVDSLEQFQIDGVGSKGKPITTSVIWATSPRTTKVDYKLPNLYILNQPKNPMPNRVNALAETYTFGGFGASGMLIGRDRTTPVDSSKYYGWLLAPKYTDVLKTLIVPKTLQMHVGGPSGITNYITNSKPILKKQKTLPPTKFDDVLLANMIALKLNIAASGLGKIPLGFGELMLNDSASYAGIGQNFLNGKMTRELAYYGDSILMGYYSAGAHVYAEDSVFKTLNRAVARVNAAFEGKLDTNYFQDSLVFKGTRPLIDVPYLKVNPSIVPARIVPLATTFMEAPSTYELYQNYPNPFNPTTTISFDLPEQAFVTLKIYNMLGQEVATLIDHEQMDDGTQEILFNANNVASGVYFYRIIAQGFDEDGINTNTFATVKKMLLVK